ncbi:MAG TPA: phosphotransferase [Chloroflexota bacterium]
MIDYAQLSRRGQIRRLRRVAENALTLYGIEPVSLSLLHHSFNTTFTVIGPGGARFVLHILRPEVDPFSELQSPSRVASELWWLDRLRADIGLAVPVAVRTPTGEGVVSVAVEGVTPARLCTLFHWIDGRFVLHRLMPAHLEAVGTLTARLHRHSEHLRVPAGFDRPTVDAADAETEEGVVRLFTDQFSLESARVMQEVFRRVRRAKEELGSGPGTSGLIHADIHQRNYLFRAGDVHLIDFGDCGWGHYLYDLAVTLSELEVSPRRAAQRAALLAGYRRDRGLSPAHERLLDTFVMLREVQNVTWFLRDQDNPSSPEQAAQIGERVAALQRLLDAGA